MTRTAVAAPAKTHGRQIFGTFLYIRIIHIIHCKPGETVVCACVHAWWYDNIKVQNTHPDSRPIYIYILINIFGNPPPIYYICIINFCLETADIKSLTCVCPFGGV